MQSLTSIQMLAFSKTCDVTQTLLIILDSQFCIRYINQYTKKTLNWKEKKAIIGQSFSKVWRQSGFSPLLDSKGRLLTYEPMTIQNHVIQWQQLIGVMNDKNGMLLIGQDITQIHKLRLHIRDLNTELKAQKSQQEHENKILANISHEITGQNMKENLSPYQYLTQVREYLENIIAKMPCFVYWKDCYFRYLGCNDMILKELGFKSKKDFIGRTDYDLGWDKKLVDNYLKIDKEIIKTGQPKFNFEEKIINKKGKEIQILSNKMPLFDGNNKVIGIVGIGVDITKRKNLEKKLNLYIQELSLGIDSEKHERDKVYQELQDISNQITGQNLDEEFSAYKYVTKIKDYYECIIGEMPCYVYWKDKNFRYLGCNDLSLNLVGLKSKDEFIGKTNYDFGWDPKLVDEYQKIDEEIINTGRPKLNIVDTVVQKNGQKQYLLVNKVPLFNDNGDVIGIVGISVDITESKRLESELKKAKEVAEKASNAKSEFIENMSHDIKTPLSGVIGMAELLTLNLKDKNFKEYAENIKKSATQLLDLFNEVLDVMNKDTVEKPESIVFELKELAQDVINFLNPTIREKNIHFKFIYLEKIADHFFGNRFNLYRIILNLISNAIKFTDDNGKVSLAIELLKAEKDQQIIEIKVSDTGIGIPKESHEAIFERYSRLTPSYTGKYKGSGLGLYIVKKMVDEMGGSVSVDSEVGKGSTFRVVIPLPLAKEVVAMPQKSSPSKKKMKKDIDHKVQSVRLLLVEDNPIAQEMGSQLLISAGCQVDIAETGQDALKKFASHAYSLVFMDIGLPDISGYEVTEKIRQYEKDKHQSPTLILGLTAHVQKQNLDKGIISGMNEIFSKPLTAALVKDILQKVVSGEEFKATVTSDESEKSKEAELPLIDFDLGAKILGSDIQAARNMIDELAKMLPGDLNKLKAAFAEKDNKKLKDMAHYIKGGASYCGTPRLKIAATELDQIIKDNVDSAAIQAAYENLCREIELLLTEYTKIPKDKT